ncbi:FAD-binding oxidoreductase [Mangrovicella endophytica]|uniref:FAD-binding oxidoreductase n=1 Tax=Mangrovicella endophytica TaxID=2066697 RepID=UPI000C9EB742|nr:FAD-binding oxidoreductase [Mangrovicella endophytica]
MAGFASTRTALSWGRVLRPRQFVAKPLFQEELAAAVREGVQRFGNGVLARGLGRSYGDSNLNDEGGLIDGTGLAGILSFDAATGLLHAEAGMTLEGIIAFALPQGFFLPVTPGTKFVTLAGAIANDVHGKNHHSAGTIGCWIEEIGLLRSDGSAHRLVPGDELFAATVGGLGLTGIITEVKLRLRRVASSRLDAETLPMGNLSDFFALAEESGKSHEYTVAWIDCLASGASLGRGLFTRANHAADGPMDVSTRKGPNVPLEAPGFLLNRWSITAMNTAYYELGRRKAGVKRVGYDSYFYPLDGVRNWNRLYGRRGMYQYQSVVPPEVSADATVAMLREIAKAGQGSFLVVLKTFGASASPGMLSFPMDGTTLALDFPNRGASTLALLARLDAIVREAKGRLYPAKDGRLPPDTFEAGYPLLERFRAHRDPGISSSFWRRMEGTVAAG